jgi:hypothetical protein
LVDKDKYTDLNTNLKGIPIVIIELTAILYKDVQCAEVAFDF